MGFTEFIDIALKYGIWCACFLALALYTLKHYEKLVKETKEESIKREESLKKENNDRELRYINTINNLTEKVDNKINVIDKKVDKIQEEVSCIKRKE
ncbi:MAG: hypothetical protein IJH12_06835 [Clostridia bacterium]|nr:hypothetical protein [Clostridia bacterium]